MNNIHYRKVIGALAALICSIALLAGCSYTAMPNNVPRIAGYDELSLKNISVIVKNSEENASTEEILTDQGEPSGFQANRRAFRRTVNSGRKGSSNPLPPSLHGAGRWCAATPR